MSGNCLACKLLYKANANAFASVLWAHVQVLQIEVFALCRRVTSVDNLSCTARTLIMSYDVKYSANAAGTTSSDPAEVFLTLQT